MTTDTPRSRRVTIADVARAAETSTASVSYALNGLPGVSAATRERVLATAERLGWAPASDARSLAGAGTGTVGLALARDPGDLADEPFYMQFIAGVESALAPHAKGLLLELAPDSAGEVAALHRWHRSRRVDGVLLTDVTADDPRVDVARRIGLPAVVVGDPRSAGGLASVWTDDATAMRQAVEHLAGLGHRSLVRFAAPTRYDYTAIRDAAFVSAARAAGVAHRIVPTDLSLGSGSAAAREVLLSADAPTGLLFDNDVTAVAALTAAHGLGLDVPGDVSIIAWDDSLLCRSVTPTLTVLAHDVVALGAHAARRLLDVVGGAEPQAHQDATPALVARDSTGPARAGS
jgi:DNA-binding LacI/PurR family transcriptional regulator